MSNVPEVDQLNQQAWALRIAHPHQAIALALQAQQAAEQWQYQSGAAQSLYIIGHCHYRIGEYEQARTCEALALALFEELNDSQGQADALNTIGNIYSALGDHHTAYTYYLGGLALRQATGNQQAEASSWNNIGNIHFHLGDYPSALEAHQKSLTLKEALHDQAGAAISLNNIGNVYKECSDPEQALRSYQQSLAIAQELDHLYGQAGALSNIGALYQQLGNWPAAQQYHLQGLVIEQAIDNRHGQAESLVQLGELYLSCSDLPVVPEEQAMIDRPLHYLQRALALANELDAKEVSLRSCRVLSQLYEQRGDFKEALSYYQRFYTLERSLSNEELAEKTRKLQIIHQVETSKRDAELKRVEAEIARVQNIELATALANADYQRQIAEEANRFKTRLLSVAAHDLRNPLSVIIGYTDLFYIQHKDATDLYDIFDPIQVSARRMEHLLQALLEVAIVEEGGLSIQLYELDLASVAREVIEMNQQRARNKAQTLHLLTEPDCIIEGDESRMWRVLDNLVSNAIKFSPPQKQIWVCVAHHDRFIRCSVRDEGPGLTQDDQRRLFGRLERLSATPTGDENTTGLGLSIVKQLVESHGGQVWAESQGSGQGSTFIVELPALVLK